MIAVGVLVLRPEFFDFNVILGAIGIILLFLADWLPRRFKSIYMALIGLLALLITAAIEFLITGVISEATKSLALTTFATLFVSYVARPVSPEDSAPV